MNEPEATVTASAWNDNVGSFNIMGIRLHDAAVSLNTVTGLMAVYKWQIWLYEQMSTENTQNGEYKDEQHRVSMRKRMRVEGAANKADFSSRTSIQNSEVSGHDWNLVGWTGKAMKAYNDIFKTFGFLWDLTSLSCEQI